MASLFKPRKITYSLPDGSYRLPDGRRVTKNTLGAVRVDLGRSETWFGKYKTGEGKTVRVALCADKTASKKMLAKLVTDAEMARRGLGHERIDEQLRRPLAEHLAEFRDALTDRGAGRQHVRETVSCVQAAIDACGFALARDIDAGRVQRFLASLKSNSRERAELPAQAEFTKKEVVKLLGTHANGLAALIRRHSLPATGNGKKRRYPRSTVQALQDRLCRGRGTSTVRHYFRAIKSFTTWLVADRRTLADPLAGLSLSRRQNQPDARHERRALPLAELRDLLTAAAANERIFRGLTGADRAMLYAVAMGTGLRAAELASLAARSFELEGPGPVVRCRAAYTKNGEEAVQPLPEDLAHALRAYLADRPAEAPVWPGGWVNDAAEMLRIDLAAAGLPYRDLDGRVADFHALRHSFVTILVQSGVSPKLAQTLARHSTITLTMDRYSHVNLFDQTQAIGTIPSLLPGKPSAPQAVRATGTHGAPGPRLDQTDDFRQRSMRTDEESAHRESVGSAQQKTPDLQGFEDDYETVMTADESSPSRIRTYNKPVNSRLLYR